jgi:hypothetical protein
LTDDDLVELALAEDATEAPAPPPEPLLTQVQLHRLSGYSAAGQPLLGERIAATRELLERGAGDRYSLELFATDNVEPARMERFLLRAREMVSLADIYVVPVALGAGRYRLRVLYGNFQDAQAANAASVRLPPKYQREFRISAHTLDDLREQL